MSLIILQAIPSLIGYIIIVLNFNCATGSFPKQKFRRWANLTPIFFVISFVLEQQAWFRVCVVPMVSITFRFIIPLTWCHHRSVTSSWKSLDKFVVIIVNSLTFSKLCVEIQDEKYHPCPRWILLSSTTLLPSHQHNLFVFGVIPWVPCHPAIVLLYSEHYHLLCHQCCENYTTS